MSDRAIIEAVRKMAGTDKNDLCHYVTAKVVSVNEDDKTCDCIAIDGHTEYELNNVKLMTTVDDGMTIIPEIDSAVKVLFSSNVESFVCQYSAIKKMTIFATDGLELGGDSFGGVVKVNALLQKLNNLEQDLTNLKSALASMISLASATTTTPVTGTSLAGFMASLGIYSAHVITPTILNELENTHVKHGV
jgi:hypothetical protein